jgi:hypothetical protein
MSTFLGKPRLDLRSIGQKFFHVCDGGTQKGGALVVLDQIGIDPVRPGRRVVTGLLSQLDETGL